MPDDRCISFILKFASDFFLKISLQIAYIQFFIILIQIKFIFKTWYWELNYLSFSSSHLEIRYHLKQVLRALRKYRQQTSRGLPINQISHDVIAAIRGNHFLKNIYCLHRFKNIYIWKELCLTCKWHNNFHPPSGIICYVPNLNLGCLTSLQCAPGCLLTLLLSVKHKAAHRSLWPRNMCWFE